MQGEQVAVARELQDHEQQLVQEVEACALEEETGFARGAAIRHKSTGAQGVLEIVYYGGAQFRLRDTTMYVTEDIRRGEWALTTQSNDPSE